MGLETLKTESGFSSELAGRGDKDKKKEVKHLLDVAQEGRMEGLDGERRGLTTRSVCGGGPGLYNQMFAQRWDSAGLGVNSLCTVTLFLPVAEEFHVPGWPRGTKMEELVTLSRGPSSFPPGSPPPGVAQARPAAAADQDQEEGRGKGGEGGREGGICLPRLGQQVEGLMEVWETSEWPSGKGSVSLGWAEAEDTLQRKPDRALASEPCLLGNPGRASDLSRPTF